MAGEPVIKSALWDDPLICARFWSRVKVLRPNQCWEWQEKSRNEHDYGIFRPTKHSGVVKAHRFAWAAVNGDLKDGIVIRHKCDNPPCCNPAHLEDGTQIDNISDAVSRRRNRRGGNGHSRLTLEDVTTIRELKQRGIKNDEIARRFGISQPYVSMILNGKRWVA